MFVNPSSAFVGCPSVVCSSSGSAKNARYARLLPSTRKSSASRAGPSSRTSSSPVSVFGLTTTTLSSAVPWPAFRSSRARGSSPSRSAPTTSSCAHRRRRRASSTWPPRCETHSPSRSPVRRSPRSRAGQARHRRRRAVRHSRSRERRWTRDRERSRRFSTSSRARGVPDDDVTLLVAGGLARRVGQKGARAPPASSPGAGIPRHASSSTTPPMPTSSPIRPTPAINPALVDADLVDRRLVSRDRRSRWPGCAPRGVRRGDDPTRRRGATRSSRPRGEPVWELALAIEAAVALAGRAPRRVAGARPSAAHGTVSRLPATTESPRRTSRRSPFRRLYSALPGAVRRGILRDQAASLAPTAVFAGTPSVAHAEALVRTVELRGTRLDEPLDAMVVGVPWIGVHAAARAAEPDHVCRRRTRARAPAVA